MPRLIGFFHSTSDRAVVELRMRPATVALFELMNCAVVPHVSVSGVILPPMLTVSFASLAAKPPPLVPLH